MLASVVLKVQHWLDVHFCCSYGYMRDSLLDELTSTLTDLLGQTTFRLTGQTSATCLLLDLFGHGERGSMHMTK